MTLTFIDLLTAIPQSLRDELFDEFNKILRNYRESKWEPTELDGGKLCEIVYAILQGYTKGTYPAKATKPNNFLESCKAFEQLPTSYSRSVRIQIPRILIALYEVRNNRGVGHVGGDVNPNQMDATYVLYSAKWLIAELIRLFHQVKMDVAENAIELIIERETPVVWVIGDVRRVLKSGLLLKDQVLLLLYQGVGSVTDKQLFEWVEHKHITRFKDNILRKMHSERNIEYTAKTGEVRISPKGIQFVEENLL